MNGPLPDEAFGNGKTERIWTLARRWAFYGEISY